MKPKLFAMQVTSDVQKSRYRLSLRWEIAIVLIIKVAALWGLWALFFSQPKTKHMQLPESEVTQHLLQIRDSALATPPHSSNSNFASPSPRSTNHDG